MVKPVSAAATASGGGIEGGLDAAIAVADLRVLLMVLFQISGDQKWLDYKPKRDVKLIADEDAGLSSQEQHDIRAAARALLAQNPAPQPAIGDPGDALMVRMMRTCLGEDVPAEYATLMREELGFLPRDIAWRAKPADEVLPTILIIGAGVSGIALGARLGRLGIPYSIIERHGDVGGVWLENRYPGAGVDTPNHSYSYSFGRTHPWARFFATRDQIYDYLRRCADEFGVRPNVRFHTRVLGMTWDAAANEWSVTVDGPDGIREMRAPIVVSAIGQFGQPSLPQIAGAESFRGPAFHSADWPDDLDLAGKKVTIIGAGASAMQIVPTIVDSVANLTIYQRTPQWARPVARYHDDIGPVQWLLDHVPLYAAWFRFTMWWRYGDGLLPLLRKDPAWPHPARSLNRRNDRHRVEMTEHIRRELGDRTDLIEKSIPAYPPFGKRILLDNGWYKAIKRPNAELVTDAIATITPSGVETTDGTVRPADVIIYATGFDMTKMAARLNVSGLDGEDLADAWAHENPRAYLGIAVPGFPNFFMMGGPNTGLGHGGSTIFQAESQARYITGLVVHMIESRIDTVNVKAAQFADYVARVDAEHEKLIWTHPAVSSYYKNGDGRVVSVMPFRLVDYWRMTREPDLADYELNA